MTTKEFQRFCNELFKETQRRTPIDTGNMRYNSLQIVFTDGGNTCHIYIDEKIAPYVFYTNEPWLSPKWHGKKNPNEGWWDKCAYRLDGRISRNAENISIGLQNVRAGGSVASYNNSRRQR